VANGAKALSIRFYLGRSSSLRYYNMAKYQQIDVSEQSLEDLIRQNADVIEEDLAYVHHQQITGSGRLDVLLLDSGHSLVLAELK
jgi:RecB family endonuclease NucS